MQFQNMQISTHLFHLLKNMNRKYRPFCYMLHFAFLWMRIWIWKNWVTLTHGSQCNFPWIWICNHDFATADKLGLLESDKKLTPLVSIQAFMCSQATMQTASNLWDLNYCHEVKHSKRGKCKALHISMRMCRPTFTSCVHTAFKWHFFV